MEAEVTPPGPGGVRTAAGCHDPPPGPGEFVLKELTSQLVSQPRYDTCAQEYKLLLHCAVSVRRNYTIGVSRGGVRGS